MAVKEPRMSPKQIEAMAQELARWECFDWATLPDSSTSEARDRDAFRQIAQAMADAATGSNN